MQPDYKSSEWFKEYTMEEKELVSQLVEAQTKQDDMRSLTTQPKEKEE